ncbi:MAG: hypothetical protein K6G83_10195, partial [Lachnospiraceae bacterium]|nr:hypothetical protein [Lachnospiraceae bacterium]
ERRSFYYYSKKNQELVRDILEGRGELADLNRKIDYVLLHHALYPALTFPGAETVYENEEVRILRIP